MFIQVHMLQNFVRSSINRDEYGVPKWTTFGGTRRALISHQAWRRAIIQSEEFTRVFDKTTLGINTKKLPLRIASALTDMKVPDEIAKQIVEKAPQIAHRFTEESESVEDKDSGQPKAAQAAKKPARRAFSARTDPNQGQPETKQMIYFGPDEARILAKQLHNLYLLVGAEAWPQVDLQERLSPVSPEPEAVDIALFGRKVTSKILQPVEGAVVIADSFSTHTQVRQFDYFTAVDGETDLVAMIGDTENNSSLHYRYLNLHIEPILKNLQGNLPRAKLLVKTFLRDCFLNA